MLLFVKYLFQLIRVLLVLPMLHIICVGMQVHQNILHNMRISNDTHQQFANVRVELL
jgi:hypothetical protein